MRVKIYGRIAASHRLTIGPTQPLHAHREQKHISVKYLYVPVAVLYCTRDPGLLTGCNRLYVPKNLLASDR